VRGISGGDPAAKSNSVMALAALCVRSIISAAGTAMTANGASKSTCECADDRSRGIVWQSCCAVCGLERSEDFLAGFLHRRFSQQCPLLPGSIKNCSQETHPPHR
jgi:hypothetical protein